MKHKEVLEYIRQAEEAEFSGLLEAVIERYRILYPDWDINILVLPQGDREERRRRYDRIIEFAQKYGNI